MIRLGISSAGSFVEYGILPRLREVDNITVAAISDKLDMAKARKLADAYSIAGVADDFDYILADDAIDAVYICSPNVFHKDMTIAAAQAGKHVFCEKPLGMNAAECRKMVDACNANHVKLAVGFCYPLAGGQQKAKELIEQGAIGEFSHIYISFNLGDYNPETVGWRCDPKISGGGPLMDLAPHLVDLAGFFFDDRIESVMAYVSPEKTDTAIETDALILLEFKRCGRAVIDTSFVRGNIHSYLAVGTKAAIRAVGTMAWQAGGKVALEEADQARDIEFDLTEGIEQEFRSFAHAVEQDAPLRATGELGLQVQAVIDAIYKSAQTGKRVSVSA